jgi:hypothetical protein
MGYTDAMGLQAAPPLVPPVPLPAPPILIVPALIVFDAAIIVHDVALIMQLGEAYGWWGNPNSANKNRNKKCQNDRWTCEASGHVTPIEREAPPGAQGRIVRARGSGPTQSEAARAALDAVQAMAPRGFYVRHPHIIRCWRR